MIKVIFIPFLVFYVASALGAQYPFFKDTKTSIKNPFEMRDPFKRKVFKRHAKKVSKSKVLKDGSYSNLPEIGKTPLNKIRIVGILLGNERRAMAKIDGGKGGLKDIYIIKEGMKIGVDDAEVKAILPGGIVVVEKITNVYDQNEYIETIIPVSAE
ncbi:MAG: hypothetical protein OEY33_04150 [Bdellovibrionales bacterium]|jgi:Tfp pilus assembly protein PilP|nr:hypothetical protein [Bdellovibrionales bacterium]